MRPSIPDGELADRITALLDRLRASSANLAVSSAAEAIAQAAEPLEARGVLAREDGRFRVRDRTVMRYYGRSIRTPAAARACCRLMFAAASKALFHGLAGLRPLQRLASRYGMAPDRGFARRFIAGETAEEAIEAARTLAARGFGVSLDYLGESVATLELADAATREYLAIVEQVIAAGVERNLSLKLTQLGLDVDRATATDNLRRILEATAGHGFFVRIDMEDSSYTDATLTVLDTVWGLGYRDVGTVLQSALRRTPADLDRLNAMGSRVRLVKGAYREPAAVAYPRMNEVDEAYVALAQRLLEANPYPALPPTTRR